MNDKDRDTVSSRNMRTEKNGKSIEKSVKSVKNARTRPVVRWKAGTQGRGQ